MTSFIDEHREGHGVEPICTILPIAPSTYYEQKARQADPSRLPERVRREGMSRELLKLTSRQPRRLTISILR
jgi:putative transposase